MPRTPPRYNCGRERPLCSRALPVGPTTARRQHLRPCSAARLHVVLPVGVQVLGREGARLLTLGSGLGSGLGLGLGLGLGSGSGWGQGSGSGSGQGQGSGWGQGSGSG